MRWLYLLPLLIGLCSCNPATLPLANQFATTVFQAQSSSPGDGIASWYGPKFAGRKTASGEIFDPSQLTAAHKTLPFGSLVEVTNLTNNMSVIVRINDRGPFMPGRVIDLSRAAAERIEMIGAGTAQVQLEVLSSATEPVIAETLSATTEAPNDSWVVAVDQSLEGYSVISSQHRVGQLLLLASSQYPQPLLVRVVSNVMSVSGVAMIVSPELHASLGATISIVAER
jgi:rare lipoprotein A